MLFRCDHFNSAVAILLFMSRGISHSMFLVCSSICVSSSFRKLYLFVDQNPQCIYILSLTYLRILMFIDLGVKKASKLIAKCYYNRFLSNGTENCRDSPVFSKNENTKIWCVCVDQVEKSNILIRVEKSNMSQPIRGKGGHRCQQKCFLKYKLFGLKSK